MANALSPSAATTKTPLLDPATTFRKLQSGRPGSHKALALGLTILGVSACAAALIYATTMNKPAPTPAAPAEVQSVFQNTGAAPSDAAPTVAPASASSASPTKAEAVPAAESAAPVRHADQSIVQARIKPRAPDHAAPSSAYARPDSGPTVTPAAPTLAAPAAPAPTTSAPILSVPADPAGPVIMAPSAPAPTTTAEPPTTPPPASEPQAISPNA